MQRLSFLLIRPFHDIWALYLFSAVQFTFGWSWKHGNDFAVFRNILEAFCSVWTVKLPRAKISRSVEGGVQKSSQALLVYLQSDLLGQQLTFKGVNTGMFWSGSQDSFIDTKMLINIPNLIKSFSLRVHSPRFLGHKKLGTGTVRLERNRGEKEASGMRSKRGGGRK
jgi:hypothetical protein